MLGFIVVELSQLHHLVLSHCCREPEPWPPEITTKTQTHVSLWLQVSHMRGIHDTPDLVVIMAVLYTCGCSRHMKCHVIA